MGPFRNTLGAPKGKGQRYQVNPKGYFHAQWKNTKVGDISFHIPFVF
jgi:hypothetical protein